MAAIADIERQVSVILKRLVHPGMRSTTNDRTRHGIQAALGDWRHVMTTLRGAVREKGEPTTDAAPVMLTPAMLATLATLGRRLIDLDLLLAVEDADDTGDRVRGYSERGTLDDVRPLGPITVTDWPNSPRRIEIDEFNAYPFAHEGLETLAREPNRVQRRRIAKSLHSLIDLLVPGRSGPRPAHAANAPRDPDPAVLGAVYEDLHLVIVAAQRDDLLPDAIRHLPHVDHDTDADELAYRVIAARLGYAPATGWRTVKAAIGGYTR